MLNLLKIFAMLAPYRPAAMEEKRKRLERRSAWAALGIKDAHISAVIIRADGTREDLGRLCDLDVEINP